MKSRQKRAYLYALIAVLMWSTIATALTVTLRMMGKVELLLWAFLVSFIVLGMMIIAKGKIGRLKWYLIKYWRLTLLLGFVNPFIYYFTLFYAYELLPAQEAQAINYTWALMLAYLSVPILGHRLEKWDILAGLICYFGVLIIATHGDPFSLDFSNIKGVLVALSSTVFWAFYWILVTKYREDTVIVLFSNFGVGLLLIIGYILWFSIEIRIPDLKPMIGAVYIGLFEMGVTFVLWGKALALTSKTSSIANLIFLSPILSLFFIYFIAGEHIYGSTVLSLVLILLGLYVQKKGEEAVGTDL